MAESALSEDGKYFSYLSQDGRLKIWDTETNVLKQEYTPDLHLSAPPSCLQWITISNKTEQKKNGKRKSSISEGIQCVALGTNKGKILIYNIAEAKIDTVLTDKITTNRITCLDWHRKHGLFSCGRDNSVLEWDIQNGEARNKYNVNIDNKKTNIVSAIKIIPHNQNQSSIFLVTASYQLRMWQLHAGVATLIKNLGHSGAANAVLNLVTLDDNCYVVEGSSNARLLSVWDVSVTADMTATATLPETPTKKQRRKALAEAQTVITPSYNFVLEDAPRIVDVSLRGGEGGVELSMGAATRSGVLHYYGHLLDSASTKPIKPTVTVHITTEDARPLPVQCCKFTEYTNKQSCGEMVLGYEATAGRLVFERVVPDTKTKTQVLIRSDPGAEKTRKKSKIDDTNKVRTTNTSEMNVTYVEPMGGVARKRGAPGGKVEVPMEARLANLTVDVAERGKAAVSQNLTKLLIQGLHSKDRSIILTVLQKDDAAVARRTVSALPADYVPPFMDQLTEMASKKTSQCAAVCTWLQALMRSHAALLLASSSTPAVAEKCSHLLTILTQRRSHLCQLMNLKGRLDLTIAQRTSGPDDADADGAAVLEYNDTSSDEEMEIEHPSSDEFDENNFEELDETDSELE